jgi:hypothetical protein
VRYRFGGLVVWSKRAEDGDIATTAPEDDWAARFLCVIDEPRDLRELADVDDFDGLRNHLSLLCPVERRRFGEAEERRAPPPDLVAPTDRA